MKVSILNHSFKHHLYHYCNYSQTTCIFLFLLTINSVHGNYCDHDLCSITSNTYCCGENMCCEYINNWTYYFWVVLVIAIIIISLFWASFHIYFGDIRNLGGRPFIVKLIEKFVEYIPNKYKASSQLMPSSPKVRNFKRCITINASQSLFVSENKQPTHFAGINQFYLGE